MSNSSTLNLRIEVDDNGSIKVRKLGDDLNQTGEKGRRAADGMNRAFTALQATIGGIALMSLGKQIIDVMDQYTLLESRLSLVTKGTRNLASVQQALYDISLRTHQSNADTVDLYTRMARATESLGLSQAKTLQITETINQALVVSGASAQESSAALMQLSQGLASGTLQGEELRSVLEQTPRLARAIADGMGVEVGALRSLAAEGKLTSEVVAQALISQKESIEKEFAQMKTNVSQSLIDLQTVVKSIIHDADKAGGATGDIVGAINDLATTIDENRDDILSLFASIVRGASTSVEWIGKYGREAGTVAGLLIGAKVAQIAFNAAVSANPYVVAAGALGILNEQLKSYDLNIGRLPQIWGEYSKSVQNVIDVLKGVRDAETGELTMLAKQAAEVGNLAEKTRELNRIRQQTAPTLKTDTSSQKQQLEQQKQLKKAEEDKIAASKKAIEDQAKTTEEMYKEAHLDGEQYFKNEAAALVKKAAGWKEAGAKTYEVEEWLYTQLGKLSEKAWETGETLGGQAIDDMQAMSNTLLDNVGAANTALAEQVSDVGSKITELNSQDINITANFDGSAVVTGVDALINKFQQLRTAATSAAASSSSPEPGSYQNTDSSKSAAEVAADQASYYAGNSVTLNINQQLSRSDVNSIVNEQKRQEARK